MIWNILLKIPQNMSWKDYPMECDTLFHSCMNMFMHQHILKDNIILGEIKKYVIRYELQHHDLFMPISYYGLMKMIYK
jgi:hypothetical protein